MIFKKLDAGLFQLEALFIAGLLFFKDGDEFKEFDNQYEIAARFLDGNIYKKVSK
ncbi:hypothetical protein NVP1181O_59 [Vibrio phage 1.181.O._10N.286.46.C9]|nr:hypothetical protein NVP1181O_59 [Vibrio phage 1.181.O._10N.286.46.C9]